MGKPKEKEKEMTTIDELRWYEVITCCCKWRGECKSCVSVTLLYGIPIFLAVSIGAACLSIGIIFRDDCPCSPKLVYWLRGCSGTWLLVVMIYCVKAIKDGYYGMTCWRLLAFIEFIMYSAWMIIGTIWVTEPFLFPCTDPLKYCSNFVKIFSLAMLCVHWSIWILSFIAQIYILSQVCCWDAENAIRPLKGNVDIYDEEL